jgi:hypothetical protein
MRWTVPVPIPSDLATLKIPTPFASCFRTLRSIALSIFGRPSFKIGAEEKDPRSKQDLIFEASFGVAEGQHRLKIRALTISGNGAHIVFLFGVSD